MARSAEQQQITSNQQNVKKTSILFLLFFSLCCRAQDWQTLPLYAERPIPNSLRAENREKTAVNDWGVAFTTETSEPELLYFATVKPGSMAVVICPGGGYSGTATDHEGIQVARAFQQAGIAAFVLKYRLPDERYCVDKSLAPLQDAQQALRLVRRNAAAWQLRPDKIGIMGFSAGGHLAATAATHFNFNADATNKDSTSARPDFAILIYPVVSFSDSLCHEGSRARLLGASPSQEQLRFFSNELQVDAQAPPAFLLHTQDDFVKAENSLAYYQACLRQDVPAELHLFPRGGHGYGLRHPGGAGSWFGLLLTWLDGISKG